jgi:predicted DNA-binding protein
MSRKIVTTVYLDPEHVEALAQLSKDTHVPQAVYIRMAVGEFLRKKGIDLEEVVHATEP